MWHEIKELQNYWKTQRKNNERESKNEISEKKAPDLIRNIKDHTK